jgi:hypothetical protein
MLLLDDAPSLPASQPPSGNWLWPAAAGLGIVLASALAWTHFREPVPLPEIVRFQFSPPPGITPPQGAVFSVSPDGRKVAFAGAGPDGVRFWLRSLDTLESRALDDRPTAAPPPPFWSPDGRYMVFGRSGGTLLKVDTSGGPTQELCQCVAIGGSWSRNGTILLGSSTAGITRTDPSGAKPVPVTTPDAAKQESHLYPVFLPDEKHFLYLKMQGRTAVGILAGSLDAKPNEQSSKVILETPHGVVWLSDPLAPASAVGTLLYMRSSTLFAQSFDSRKLEFIADPVQVAPQTGSSAALAWGHFSGAGTTLVFRRDTGDPGLQLTWLDRSGKVLGPVGEPGQTSTIVLSPDGERAALVQPGPEGSDIWIANLVNGTKTRLTFEPGNDSQPIWSPDGTKIIQWVGWGTTRHQV